ncbi:MAG: MauE/DoxX family redox-associated membrane protein [Acidimicrobiales bacterium]
MIDPTAVITANVVAAADGADWTGVASTMAVGLAAVFAFAALTKAIAPTVTGDDFAALQLPAPRLLARLVPGVELAVAVVLVARPRLGAVLALCLLTAFTAVIVRTVRAGLEVSCGCLGSMGERPVSVDAVVRNALLAVMALVAVTAPALTVPGLAAMAIFVGFSLVAAVVVQLTALREITGRLWSVELAGEAPHRSKMRKEPS